MSEHIMENLTIRPLNDVSERLSKRANEYEIRNGTLSALTERCNRLQSENAKLRELVRRYSEYTSQDHCEGCFCKLRCNDGDVDECWQLTEMRRMARELGIELE